MNGASVIAHNVAAQYTYDRIAQNKEKQNKTIQKLSSGYKINKAGDDAAGLAISESMRNKINGLDQGENNIKDGIGIIQTAEGALTEVHSMLKRMTTLATESANGTFTDDVRKDIEAEVQQLKKEINRIAYSTDYNGVYPLNQDSRYTPPIDPTIKEFTMHTGRSDSDTASLSVSGSPEDQSITRYYVDTWNLDNENATIKINETEFKLAALQSQDNNQNMITTNGSIDYHAGKYSFPYNGLTFTITLPEDSSEGLADLDDGILDIKNGISNAYMFKLRTGDISFITDDQNLMNSLGPSHSIWHFDGKTLSIDVNDEKFSATLGTKYFKANQISSRTDDENGNCIIDSNTVIYVYNADKTAFFRIKNPRAELFGVDNYNKWLTSSFPDAEYYSVYNGYTNTVGSLSSYQKEDDSIENADNVSDSPLIAPIGMDKMPVVEHNVETFRDPIWIQQSANSAWDGLYISTVDATAKGIGIDNISVATLKDANAAITTINDGVNKVSSYRAMFGATQNRLEHMLNSNRVTSENVTAAESRIRDTDMAKEVAEMTKQNILQQAGQSVLQQSINQPNQVLQMLQ